MRALALRVELPAVVGAHDVARTADVAVAQGRQPARQEMHISNSCLIPPRLQQEIRPWDQRE